MHCQHMHYAWLIRKGFVPYVHKPWQLKVVSSLLYNGKQTFREEASLSSAESTASATTHQCHVSRVRHDSDASRFVQC